MGQRNPAAAAVVGQPERGSGGRNEDVRLKCSRGDSMSSTREGVGAGKLGNGGSGTLKEMAGRNRTRIEGLIAGKASCRSIGSIAPTPRYPRRMVRKYSSSLKKARKFAKFFAAMFVPAVFHERDSKCLGVARPVFRCSDWPALVGADGLCVGVPRTARSIKGGPLLIGNRRRL